MNRSSILAFLALAFATSLHAGPSKPEPDPAGAKLWAQNCARCHNARPAKSFSDAQWEVITHHMRVRAYLTGKEARLVTQFLKETN